MGRGFFLFGFRVEEDDMIVGLRKKMNRCQGINKTYN